METITLSYGSYLDVLRLLNIYHTADTNVAHTKDGVICLADWIALQEGN
jgi:hypothetical protein